MKLEILSVNWLSANSGERLCGKSVSPSLFIACLKFEPSFDTKKLRLMGMPKIVRVGLTKNLTAVFSPSRGPALTLEYSVCIEAEPENFIGEQRLKLKNRLKAKQTVNKSLFLIKPPFIKVIKN